MATSLSQANKARLLETSRILLSQGSGDRDILEGILETLEKPVISRSIEEVGEEEESFFPKKCFKRELEELQKSEGWSEQEMSLLQVLLKQAGRGREADFNSL